MSFKIKGKIQGLTPGDTLYFERVTQPGYQTSFAFEVIVEKPNEFYYEGEHPNESLYLMSYRPVSGQEVELDRIGAEFLIKDQEVILTGNTDQIYYPKIEGGVYDNELLQEALNLDNSLSSKIGELYRLRSLADNNNDTKATKEYSLEIESFYTANAKTYEQLDSLYQNFYNSFPSSDITIVETLAGVRFKPYDISLARYQKMDDKARESHFGKALKKELDILGKLQPGADAPDFELTALDGSKVSLKDFKGSYILLYHWGVCPGSFQRENDIVQFQNEYKDKVSVIGITDNILEIEQLYDQTNENAKSYGMSVKPILKSMLAHPWLEVEKLEANKQMLEDYPFASLPYFVFISPEGKIISRGSHKTFFKAKELLESESDFL